MNDGQLIAFAILIVAAPMVGWHLGKVLVDFLNGDDSADDR